MNQPPKRVRKRSESGAAAGIASAAIARRRPRQARARATQAALEEAFVRLLAQSGNVTMRQVATLAGVGLGTAYEYFPSKEALSAWCLHARFKRLAKMCEDRLQASPPTAGASEALEIFLRTVWSEMERNLPQWSALMQLERHLPSPPALAKMLQRFSDLLVHALKRARDWPGSAHTERFADTAVLALFGMTHQALQRLVRAQPHHLAEIRRAGSEMLHAYLAATLRAR